jgi:hypothetical protein
MTKEEIISMAREAGFIIHEFQGRQWTREPHTGCDLDPNLERFAKLVTEKEREECALLCAVISLDSRDGSSGYTANRCATKIRARGQQ